MKLKHREVCQMVTEVSICRKVCFCAAMYYAAVPQCYERDCSDMLRCPNP